jgi:hypothetical protein
MSEAGDSIVGFTVPSKGTGRVLQYHVMFEDYLVKAVRNGSTGSSLKLVDSVHGKLVGSLPLGKHRDVLRNVPVKDLVAWACRNAVADGHLLTEAWITRTGDKHIKVIAKDGNYMRVTPDNLQVVARLESPFDIMVPDLPPVCFAKAPGGRTVCGRPSGPESRVCPNHCTHTEAASQGWTLSRLCIFRFRLKAAVAEARRQAPPAASDSHASCTCLEPLTCASCLQGKLAEVDADIDRLTRTQWHHCCDHYAWATDPMFALFEPRHPRAPFKYERPHVGLCMAFANKCRTRLCLKPVWQVPGKAERLICMDHIIEHTPHSEYTLVEQAVKMHLTNLMYKNSGTDCQLKDDRNPHMATAAFLELTKPT